MIPTSTLLACIFTLFVSLILPVLILLVWAGKNKKQGIVSAWLLGAAGFLMTQICIRLPIIPYLILTIFAGLSLWMLKTIQGRWQEQEVSHVQSV